MAEGFVQRNGSLPYIEGTPNASAFKEPYPYFEFRQDDDLPYIIGTPESYAFESPTPYALYKQSDDKYNGLPYLDFPEAYGFTIPTPFALYMQRMECMTDCHILTSLQNF